MSGDETLAFLICLAVAAVLWIRWYWRIARVTRFISARIQRILLWLVPLLCGALLLAVLRFGASSDVRNSRIYLLFYMVLGAAWLAMGCRLLVLTGVSAHDDAVERHNPAAAFAVTGALLAVTLCFAGGNIGDGPGWWVVFFSAGLSTAGLFLVWGALEYAGDVSESITIERDSASGIRLAGFLVGAGLILGRSVAGDWRSASATVIEFFVGAWPVLVLLLAAMFIERLVRPSLRHRISGTISIGLVPALTYVAGGILVVIAAGIPA